MKCNVVTLILNVSVFAAFVYGAGDLNDKCRLRADCNSIGYICWKNFTCQCLYPTYVPNKKRDKCVGVIDQICKYDEHCIEGAYCKEQKECQCKDDFFLVKTTQCARQVQR